MCALRTDSGNELLRIAYLLLIYALLQCAPRIFCLTGRSKNNGGIDIHRSLTLLLFFPISGLHHQET